MSEEQTQMPRPEYPRPQFQRDPWINLNGPWSCELDFGKSGRDRALWSSKGFDREILVPFCPESALSGIGHRDFIEWMWYHRKIIVPASWSGLRVLLHFGAVDFECEVFVDGTSAGRHWGGSSSFSFDITELISAGITHDLVVWVRDDLRGGLQTVGKQCPDYASRRCHYTRTTGIWQTVWLEAVHEAGLERVRIIPDVDRAGFLVMPQFLRGFGGTSFEVELKTEGRVVASQQGPAASGAAVFLHLDSPRLWAPGEPFLYDLSFVVRRGMDIVDRVEAYAGLRKIHVEGSEVLLNNEPVYQRLVLDQGFYPDGIWTAPNDEALRRDIELSMAAGFNGARLHQKVFEERFHYWADKLGYLTWGESASWGLDTSAPEAGRNFLNEWREILLRDGNHPSIVAWSPFNETRQNAGSVEQRRLQIDAYELTRALDQTRPVNDASGYIHYRTDLYTVHNYEQDPEKLREILDPDAPEGVFRNFPDHDAAYDGQPYIIDEFGGIKWDPATQGDSIDAERRQSWGYGAPPADIGDFYRRLEGLVRTVRSRAHISGYCYTQLTDVEQEQNGIYFYDRSTKFDMERVRRIFSAE